MKPGIDYIGVGVGAVVRNTAGELFLAQRGPKAGNERGTWEFPGGRVEYGELLEASIKREFIEEFGMTIEIEGLLGIYDHLLPDEGQHWISPTYLARHISGEPHILEPGKCTAIGWFPVDRLPQPLSIISQHDVEMVLRLNQTYQEKQ